VILVDTSVWIDHFRTADELLADLLSSKAVLTHPFVIGELALGNLRHRNEILMDLEDLPQVVVAEDAEVMRLIDAESLFGLGIGYVDAHLVAATRLTPDASLWTRDRRLAAVAERLSIAARLTH
jgi:predicted nucleic acid-binding protein